MAEVGNIVALGNSSEELFINDPIYEFDYEYYEFDVSFDGLKANKYSIVIAFWVGLAVFMIFLFIILMLMSRSGPAPAQIDSSRRKPATKFTRNNRHQEQAENVINCVVSSLLPPDTGKAANASFSNEQKCPEATEGPQLQLDNTVIPGRVIPQSDYP
ncbi:melanocortin-2 receptor accessory protein 2-like [Pristis pectinata]|uniref:melanocortin-2 receptor accessory protein 2-like n=1 Tax=Pristis pectinata TaxID=685728 RepID=UPI00223E679E|nr:melanocortin-2 receptor accessory protein 2-like [Pristis pectinata]XP_051870220.1 melanocortin-2 receptor accessory protein 2-like [Pristis pectinata]XP_051870222.1 melanocortin-2 receptor accessory protein 2-like [Pristis pectinata]XP_051870223.1 melanocortin-2 receptor accessory protein 2-like [Pristis pectinata]